MSTLVWVGRVVTVLGALVSGVSVAALYAIDGETDEMGEYVGPPSRVGIVVYAVLGASPWLPFLWGVWFAL